MLVDKTIVAFLEEVDSSSCAPGGGSVSALASALGVCLTRMYGHLSIEKKKFLALEEEIQTSFKKNFMELIQKKEALIQAIDQDTIAYDNVMKAYGLSKNSEEEKQLRKIAIDKASLEATISPYNIMKLSLEAMQLCKDFIPYGNQNALSDLACGILLLDAGIQGAGLNVLINLPSLHLEDQKAFSSKMQCILKESTLIKEEIIKEVKNRLTQTI